MASQKILVPYNFTPYDQKALDFIIQTFSHSDDVAITLFHTYTPAPKIDVHGSPIMENIKSNVAFLSKKIIDQEEELKAAIQNLLQCGFAENRLKYTFKPRKNDIATEIINFALEHNYNIIVVNHQPGKLSHFFTGNVYSKIINALKDTIVCVVS